MLSVLYTTRQSDPESCRFFHANDMIVLKSSYEKVAREISVSMVPDAPHGSLLVASVSFFSSSVPATSVVAVNATFLAYDA